MRLADDRRYEATVDEVVGSVRLQGNWSRRHRAELGRYRRRSRDRPHRRRGRDTSFCTAPHGWRFGRPPDAAANGGPALVLEPRVADQEVLHTRDGHGDTRWRPEFCYDISPPDEGWTLPVWLTPNIAADRERHVLELYVQWCTRKPERPHIGVPLRTIEVLELAVPAHWGTVEHMTDLGDDRLIGQPELDEADDVGPPEAGLEEDLAFPKRKTASRLRLAVRFSDSIDTEHTLTGRLEARFRGAVSGLTRIGLYRTDGRTGEVARRCGLATDDRGPDVRPEPQGPALPAATCRARPEPGRGRQPAGDAQAFPASRPTTAPSPSSRTISPTRATTSFACWRTPHSRAADRVR